MNGKKPSGRSRSPSEFDEDEDLLGNADAAIPEGHEIESVTSLEEAFGDGKGGATRWLYIVYRPVLGGIAD